MKRVRIAARGSKLSRIQVERVEELLREMGYETEFLEVKTRADLFDKAPLESLGKGVFEKEVNQAVLTGAADLAVHSMKDLQTNLETGLEIAATLKRDPPYDALISNVDLLSLPPDSAIGTSSVRRKFMIRALRPDLRVLDLRGNVDTRLSRYLEGKFDGIVLAEASIKRMDLKIRYFSLDPILFTPAVNQGIIAVVARKGSEIAHALRKVSDEETMEEAIAERAALEVIGGGCHSPLGVLFQQEGPRLHGIASIFTETSRYTETIEARGRAEELGRELGRRILRRVKNEGVNVKA
jgi:hydroxymethylbilane synthase